MFSTVLLDPSFQGGQVQTHFITGNDEAAATAAVLKSGKLLVGGVSSPPSSASEQLIFALYNRDGTLSNSFDGDGKLILDAATTKTLREIRQIVALPYGGALISGYGGILKLLADGKPDTTFGSNKNGIVAGFPRISDVSVTTSGQIRVLTEGDFLSTHQLFTYNANGILKSTTTSTASTALGWGDALFKADGTVIQGSESEADQSAGKTSDYKISEFELSGKPVVSFGNNGVVDLTAAYDTWANGHGPFTVPQDDGPNVQVSYPELVVESEHFTSNGTITIEAVINGSSPKLHTFTKPSIETDVFITIDPSGKTVQFHGDLTTGSQPIFSGYLTTQKSGVNGTFYNASGSPTDVSVFGGNAELTAAFSDTDGATYLVGGFTPNSNIGPFGGFVVARVLPFVQPPASGSITGILFSDDNFDQKLDNGEKIVPGRVVYIDANHNGKLDAGEKSTTTDSTGRYTFTGLAAGSYDIKRVLPNSDYRITTSTTPVNLATNQTLTFNIGSTSKPPTTVKDLVFA